MRFLIIVNLFLAFNTAILEAIAIRVYLLTIIRWLQYLGTGISDIPFIQFVHNNTEVYLQYFVNMLAFTSMDDNNISRLIFYAATRARSIVL